MSPPTSRSSRFYRPIPVTRAELWRGKARATAVHLAISAAIFLPFLWLILAHWYPLPFFYTDGGWQGVRIMLAVDMVIGPFLTLLVYHPAKTRTALAIDYTVICAVQLAAIAYGAIQVSQPRPAVVSFHEGRLQTVRWDMLHAQGMTDEQLRAFGEGSPRFVFARTPVPGTPESAAVARQVFVEAIPTGWNIRLFEPWAERLPEVFAGAVDMAAEEKRLADVPPVWREVAARAAAEGATVHWLRIQGRYRTGYLALRDDGTIYGYAIRDE